MGFGQMLKGLKDEAGTTKAGLDEKKKNLDAYTASLDQGSRPSTPAPVNAPVDRINPKARYGDRPGEKRLSFGMKIGATR